MDQKEALSNIFINLEKFIMDLHKFHKDQTVTFLRETSSSVSFGDQKPRVAVDRKQFVDMKAAMKFTKYTLEQDLKVNKNKKMDFSLEIAPAKKMKLQQPLNSEENKENEGVATNSSDLNILPSSADPQANKGVKRKSSDIETLLERKEKNGIAKLIHPQTSNWKSLLEQSFRFLPCIASNSPMGSARTLSCRFRGCINLVPESRLSASQDIDRALGVASGYGKILRIQSHWNKSGSLNRPITQWSGTVVSYQRTEDSQAALKGIFVRRLLRVNPIYIPDFLLLIGRMETKLPAETHDSPGSSILITGLNRQAARLLLPQQLCLYGLVLSAEWKVLNKQNTCEVTYRFVVEAVAASLGLNGKRLARDVLGVTVKINQKEMNLHMLVRGHNC